MEGRSGQSATGILRDTSGERRKAGQLTIWGQCGEGHNSWRAVEVVSLMRYKLERSDRALLVTLSVS